MNKTEQQRQDKIIEILSLLHDGGSFEEAKNLFQKEFDNVDVSEITYAEKTLIQSGLDPSEIQKLCNIHASIFKGSIKDIHHSNYEHEQIGHPAHTLKLENQVLQSLLTDEIDELLAKIKQGDWSVKERLNNALQDLKQINKHYTRKETLIFSYMEKYGITAPPKVMWGVDDEIRELLKELIATLNKENAVYNILDEQWETLKNEIEEMIFKEEEIMLPMTLEVFTLKDWQQIADDSYDIGFSFIPAPAKWLPGKDALQAEKDNEPIRQQAIQKAQRTTENYAEGFAQKPDIPPMEESFAWESQESANAIVFPTGYLQLEQLLAMFKVLPVDLTFVDNEDRVRFFSEGEKRVFPRTKSVIGREVINCHPPKSMHVVQEILDDFHHGEREQAEFWIDMGERKVYIRYFALRNEQQQYLGCLEVTQDISHIQSITGQKRLLDK